MIIPIADVHGSKEWKQVIDIAIKHPNWYFVFLGDYFDSWENNWPDQGENFNNICNWVREDTVHRKLLIGNHDWSYITSTSDGTKVSGHQHIHAFEIKALLKANLDILDIAFESDGWVFSHAGFSNTWVSDITDIMHKIWDKYPANEHKTKDDFNSFEEYQNYLKNIYDTMEPWTGSFTVDNINKLFHEIGTKYKPFDELLDWYGCFSSSGDEVSQGPLWIRFKSLLDDAYFQNQIVGHSEIAYTEPAMLKKGNTKVIVIDSPKHNIIYKVNKNTINKEFMTLLDYSKFDKQVRKAIADFRSLQVCSGTEIPLSVLENKLKSFGIKHAKDLIKDLNW